MCLDVVVAAVAGGFAVPYVSIPVDEVDVLRPELIEESEFGVDSGPPVGASALL